MTIQLESSNKNMESCILFTDDKKALQSFCDIHMLKKSSLIREIIHEFMSNPDVNIKRIYDYKKIEQRDGD